MPHGITENLPKIFCDNCGSKFQPRRRYRDTEKRFCKDNCRKEFHKRGGSFSKLKPVIIAEVRRAVKERDPLDFAWQRKIETEIAKITETLERFRSAFNFRGEAKP